MSTPTEERRIVTVLFADMAGSTALGEELDPEEMRRLLARYYTIARDIITQRGGTIEKFIGDAVMAVFGLRQRSTARAWPVAPRSAQPARRIRRTPRASWRASGTTPPPLPSTVRDADIASAALRAVAHFGYNANAKYMVFTPSGHFTNGFKTTYCAYHSSTSSSSGSVGYGA